MHQLGQRFVAAVVARWTPGGNDTATRCQHLDSRRQIFQRRRHGGETASVEIGIVLGQLQDGTFRLGLAATHPRAYPSSSGRGRDGGDAPGGDHRRWCGRVEPCCDSRPVRDLRCQHPRRSGLNSHRTSPRKRTAWRNTLARSALQHDTLFDRIAQHSALLAIPLAAAGGRRHRHRFPRHRPSRCRPVQRRPELARKRW